MTRFSALMKKSNKQLTCFFDSISCNNKYCYAYKDGKKIKISDIFDGTYQVYQNKIIVNEAELTDEGVIAIGGDLEKDGTLTSNIEIQVL
jgi:hypothetical protein